MSFRPSVSGYCPRFLSSSSEVKCEVTRRWMGEAVIQAGDSETLGLIAAWLTQYRKRPASS